MERKYYNLILGIIFVVFSFLAAFEYGSIHGFATSGDVSSNVTISNSLAIDFSSALSSGIYFGEVKFLPATNVNATENYNGTDNATEYYVLVSEDGNVAIDLCIKANAPLTSSALDVIGLGNESYYYNINSTNLSLPSVSNEVSLTLNYAKAGENIPVGDRNYLRFWLDVPASQASGEYNNSIYFKGIGTGNDC